VDLYRKIRLGDFDRKSCPRIYLMTFRILSSRDTQYSSELNFCSKWLGFRKFNISRKQLGMCGVSLLNTDDTDATATASVAVVLVLLLLTFQCSMTLGPFSVTKSVQYLHQHHISLCLTKTFRVSQQSFDLFLGKTADRNEVFSMWSSLDRYFS
jgi:hypothetical protein